jgi:aspartyl/asparaginyl beta-hydroxylase (cupin superfamily)
VSFGMFARKFIDNEHTFKGDHSTWNATYNMHEIQINLLRKKFIYNFDNNNAYTTNWENIKSQALELTTKNDTNIWMDKFPIVDIGFLHKILLIVLEWNHITIVMNMLTHI